LPLAGTTTLNHTFSAASGLHVGKGPSVVAFKFVELTAPEAKSVPTLVVLPPNSYHSGLLQIQWSKRVNKIIIFSCFFFLKVVKISIRQEKNNLTI